MQLLLFLDSCGGIEGATKVIKIYYDIKRTSPELFLNRDPENPKIQQCLQHQDYFHLPCLPDGSLLIFHRLSSSKASHYVFEEAIKTFFMTIGKKWNNFIKYNTNHIMCRFMSSNKWTKGWCNILI